METKVYAQTLDISGLVTIGGGFEAAPYPLNIEKTVSVGGRTVARGLVDLGEYEAMKGKADKMENALWDALMALPPEKAEALQKKHDIDLKLPF